MTLLVVWHVEHVKSSRPALRSALGKNQQSAGVQHALAGLSICANNGGQQAQPASHHTSSMHQKTGLLPLSSSTTSSPAKPSCATRPTQRSRKGVKGPKVRASGFSPAAAAQLSVSSAYMKMQPSQQQSLGSSVFRALAEVGKSHLAYSSSSSSVAHPILHAQTHAGQAVALFLC